MSNLTPASIAGEAGFNEKSIADTKTQVEEALVAWGGIEVQKINGNIRLSDIIGLIDNLDNVESVTLQSTFTSPYPRPDGHVNVLNWSTLTTLYSTSVVTWQLKYTGSNFQVFKENVYLADVSIGSEYVDPNDKFSFTIAAGSYTSGNVWEFKVYPFLLDFAITDYTVATIDVSDLIITVLPQSTNSRNPTC